MKRIKGGISESSKRRAMYESLRQANERNKNLGYTEYKVNLLGKSPIGIRTKLVIFVLLLGGLVCNSLIEA